MRIIGGKYKRRRFDVPKSFNARPTTDFAKENLFNVLQHYIDLEGITALDLFSGTGSISVELLSRGASRVVALEQRREHATFIHSVAKELGEEKHLQVLQADVFRFIRGAKSQSSLYDFIFADPPYKLSEIAVLPELILSSGLLKPDGLLVVEHPQQYDFSSLPHFAERRVYGSVNFSLFFLGEESSE
ncbi:16S rRNA (guanine(966)-N(2))-methyltransferase RsmD [Porphyromonas catoniae]|uniref:16S rRNA (Guanine(966)-N(2))-methyltransferase RsmD n=1 Tax=Porphyromonas catoniae ATCC 51270 TaxID=887901 RepID=Z4WX67_9PORP|nr:16S rRNA (guanine(966)-N(2))-methyltransferase RsmD [Porphyromonas catoniae]EWC92084.1 16S rRNA (guanine(966)-N(2))-methyltransferase RsmD [Porphyromonas catoniae ATCC 51270]